MTEAVYSSEMPHPRRHILHIHCHENLSLTPHSIQQYPSQESSRFTLVMTMGFSLVGGHMYRTRTDPDDPCLMFLQNVGTHLADCSVITRRTRCEYSL